MVNGASKSVREFLPKYRNELAAMITPFVGNAPATVAALGIPWACDNGCYPSTQTGGFSPEKFRRMLERVEGLPGLLWIAVPDYVERLPDGSVRGCARKTRAMFDEWAPEMEARGYPLAYVLQDDVTRDEIPWNRIVCVFIGGSDEFKLGHAAAELARIAGMMGKLVHMGRVNSRRRIRYARSIGCDSVDGTATSRFGMTKLPDYLEWARAAKRERPLFGGAS